MNIQQLMQQAQKMQETMQKSMAEAQEQLKQLEVVGQAGAGLVSITLNGKHDVKRVHLDASLLSEDKEVLEDLIAAAMNDAVRQVEAESQRVLGKATSGLGLPPGFKMPF